MNQQIETTYKILDRAVTTYKPSTIIVCYSGGYDSMVMSHLITRWLSRFSHSANVVFASVDTLISADGWREFVKSSAKQIGVKRFEIWNNPDLDLWKNDVETRGFVYRKAQHKIYFYYLKQRVFRAMQAHYKKHNHDRIMFLNGVRRAESSDRLHAPEVEKRGAGIFVNPVVYWSDDEILRYRMDNKLPINPFYDIYHNSGDCLCNWHNRISLSAVVVNAPQVAKIIIPLDQHNQKVFGYGYDNEPAKKAPEGQLPLFGWDTECTPNLCAGCSRPDATNEMLDFVALQRMEW